MTADGSVYDTEDVILWWSFPSTRLCRSKTTVEKARNSDSACLADGTATYVHYPTTEIYGRSSTIVASSHGEGTKEMRMTEAVEIHNTLDFSRQKVARNGILDDAFSPNSRVRNPSTYTITYHEVRT